LLRDGGNPETAVFSRATASAWSQAIVQTGE